MTAPQHEPRTLAEHTREHLHELIGAYTKRRPRPPYDQMRGALMWRDDVLKAVRRGEEHRTVRYRLVLPDTAREHRSGVGPLRLDHRSLMVVALVDEGPARDLGLDVLGERQWADRGVDSRPLVEAAELYRVRVRNLRLADGGRIDTREALGMLLLELGASLTPEDLAELVELDGTADQLLRVNDPLTPADGDENG